LAKPRVFVSSTCYDLAEIRDSLVDFVASFGFEPMLSERGDVFYHPDLHTQESCLGEVGNCQMLILVIGGRFGGSYIYDSTKSIVNAEYLAAREEKIPVFTFVKKSVYADHHLYTRNRSKDILNKIDFPSIDDQSYAVDIFSFIDHVRTSPVNNGYFPFEYGRDIAALLRKQWSGMFHDFLLARSMESQNAVTTSLLKNVSMASSKVEELVKSLYRHVDQVDAEKSIADVEIRAAAIRFFSNTEYLHFLNRFKGDLKRALLDQPREGKWYEYMAAAIGAEHKDDVRPLTGEKVIFMVLGGHGIIVDSPNPKSSFARTSAQMQELFEETAKLNDAELEAVLDHVLTENG